jgi:anti-sigma factor (TIGR02949 family)
LYEIDCDQVLRDLEAYCDAELSSDKASAVEAHLMECSPCLERREFRTALQELVRKKCGGVSEVPPGLMERIRASLEPHAV